MHPRPLAVVAKGRAVKGDSDGLRKISQGKMDPLGYCVAYTQLVGRRPHSIPDHQPTPVREGSREGALYCYLRGGRTKEPVKTRGKRRKTGEGGDPPTDHATQHTTRISFDTPLLLLPLPIAWPGFCVAAQSKAVDFCRCQVQGEMIFW